MERVLAVWDFHDGPRTGIAEYQGRAHYFSCLWDEALDDYSPAFHLWPITQATLVAALEQWAIWCTWEDNYQTGQTEANTHPGTGGIDTRYDQLQQLLDAAVAALPERAIEVTPAFIRHAPDVSRPAGVMRGYSVQWAAC